ncbi:MAG: mitochondrial fission ELM1 family protein [Hyphomicrobiaceae bacterium]|nr:mitochondrial fission ELM1 family protein [Hyphomicrobiaceae bacterium]
MEVQVAGVAKALKADIKVKRVAPGGVWRLLAPWIGMDPRDGFGKEGGQFAPPWPDIVLATGRLSIPALRAIRKASPETYTVIIQDPRTGGSSADFIAVPAHDKLTGDNVMHTLTAPHKFLPERLSELRRKVPEDIASLPRPRVTIILGGPNAIYKFTGEDSARLGASLASLASLGASFLITVSRRTPDHALKVVEDATAKSPRLVWSGKGENPYEHWLAHGDMFVVTADSINMTGEACATGKPVYVFEPEGGSAKFDRFHESLRRYGATRRLPERFEQLESWTYAPLDSATQIAAEIERRWSEKQAHAVGG